MGGGGGSDKIAREQQRQEEARLAAIQSGIAATNKAFDSPERQAQYADYLDAQREMYFGELEKQLQETQRQNKFSLARSGLVGSRQQVDRGADIGEAHNKGVIDSDRLAQRALADLRGADEAARMQTIQLVQSGADATTASSAALRQMQTNLGGARGEMNANALGQVFGGFADMYKQSQERAADQKARRELGALYNTSGNFGFGAPVQVGGWGGNS